MINKEKIEVEKIYQKIDKLAKVGNDNYLNYHIFVDDIIKRSQYNLFKITLELKYDIMIEDIDISTAKKMSWKKILFKTNSTFQELHKNLFKSRGVYQVGPYYHKQLPRTRAVVIDSKGSGAELEPVLVNGGVTSINIIKPGQNYSASASVVITGGVIPASATPVVIGSKIYQVNVTATGSSHNRDPRLGVIDEVDKYISNLPEGVASDLFQKLSKNKTTILIAKKDGATQSATFSSWNIEQSYDKNLNKLYTLAIDYLLN